jgi:hypothetical protein
LKTFSKVHSMGISVGTAEDTMSCYFKCPWPPLPSSKSQWFDSEIISGSYSMQCLWFSFHIPVQKSIRTLSLMHKSKRVAIKRYGFNNYCHNHSTQNHPWVFCWKLLHLLIYNHIYDTFHVIRISCNTERRLEFVTNTEPPINAVAWDDLTIALHFVFMCFVWFSL